MIQVWMNQIRIRWSVHRGGSVCVSLTVSEFCQCRTVVQITWYYTHGHVIVTWSSPELWTVLPFLSVLVLTELNAGNVHYLQKTHTHTLIVCVCVCVYTISSAMNKEVVNIREFPSTTQYWRHLHTYTHIITEVLCSTNIICLSIVLWLVHISLSIYWIYTHNKSIAQWPTHKSQCTTLTD